MRHTIRTGVVLLALVLLARISHAQLESGAEFSLGLSGTVSSGCSKAMGGVISEFASDLANNGYNNFRWPFYESKPLGVAIDATYRFAGSPWSVWLGGHRVTFHADNDRAGTHANSVDISILSLALGGEYVLGDRGTTWNTVARAGFGVYLHSGTIVFSNDGNNPVNATTIPIPTATRFGVEGLIGERMNLSTIPLSLELGLTYSQTNLIGKSYVDPGTQVPGWPNEIQLNDGDTDAHGRIGPMVIAYWGLRFGARYWL